MAIYVIVSRACSDCGGEISVAVLGRKPIREDFRDVELLLGGMWCINTRVFQVELDGAPTCEDSSEL